MKKKLIGSYIALQLLGYGSSAEVFLAKSKKDSKHLVAIKLLHAYVIEEEIKKKFFEEANIIERLSHPGIIQVIDAGIDNTRPYFVMSYAPLGNLRQKYPKESVLPL